MPRLKDNHRNHEIARYDICVFLRVKLGPLICGFTVGDLIGLGCDDEVLEVLD
jgi:hypothetical protein